MNVAATHGLDARLYHIHVGSADPERLVAFHAEIFGTTRLTVGGRLATFGPDRGLVVSEGRPKSLLGVAYAVRTAGVLADLAARLTRAGVGIEAGGDELFEPGAIAFRDPDGRRVTFGVARRPQVAPAVMPARLQHAVVGSTDPDRMAAFYTEVVGMIASDRVRDEAGALKVCFLRTDEEHHSFAVFKTSENRFDHHSYEATSWTDIRDWGDRLAERHIRVQWGPGRHGAGNNLFVFFHDPDGNWIEISTELEICDHDRPEGLWRHEERTLNLWGPGLLRS